MTLPRDEKLLRDGFTCAEKIYAALKRDLPDEPAGSMSLGLFIMAVAVAQDSHMPHDLMHTAVDVASALLNAAQKVPQVSPQIALQVDEAMSTILNNLTKES